MAFDPSIFVSLAFLFGIAANFRAMDGYSFLRSLVGLFERRLGALYAVVLVTSIFSPVILNDVVILILTPVLVRLEFEPHQARPWIFFDARSTGKLILKSHPDTVARAL